MRSFIRRLTYVITAKHLRVIVVAVCLVLLVLIWKGNADKFMARQPKLQIGSGIIKLKVANSLNEQRQGLSGRESLADNSGMLFVYNDSERRCFWMKNMRFPIDIVWLDADKRIVHIYENLSPNTYPESFCSDELARYVIELNSGMVKKLDLSIGQQLTF